MVENQLRPNKIKEKEILNCFRIIEKENFITGGNKSICYSDKDFKISSSRGYLKNLHLAQIITNAKIKKTDKVLHVGGLTGYLTIIISKICKKVFVIENEDKNLLILKNYIENKTMDNIEIIRKDLLNGYVQESPYDIIIIDCPIYHLNNDYLDQLNNNGGRLIYIQKISQHISKAYRITKYLKSYTNEYLFDVFSNLSIDMLKEEFKF